MDILDRFRLDGQIAIVTGALGKLGTVWVQALLEAGAKVAALDLPSVPVPEGQRQMQIAFGPENLKFYAADITVKEDLLKIRQEIRKQLGDASILVNNAGIDHPAIQSEKTYELQDIPPEVFNGVFDVNVSGAFYCIQVFGPEMAKKGKGAIINITSVYATVSPDARLYEHFNTEPAFLKMPAYGASKAALLNLTKYFAAHWGSSGIRVNALTLGGVEAGQDNEFKRKYSERVPMGRMARTDDLGGPLLFLASGASSYVNGAELKVDGGFTVW
jgi:NAD(P)-dependent dehydrogenase (short-subunit alcohol dehydrogenase family)